MKKTFVLLLLVLFMLIPLSVFSAGEKQKGNGGSHVLILQDGSEYRGFLKEIDTEKIIFVIDGEEKVFDKQDVSKINFQQSRMYENVTHIKEIKDAEIKAAWQRSKGYKEDQYNRIVYLLDKTEVSFDGEYIVERIKVAAKIRNENGKDFKTGYFYYMKNVSQAKLLYGITVSPDGSVHPVDQEAVNDDAINNRYPQYDFLHRVKFGLKKIDVGSFFVWEAEIRTLYDPLHQPLFYREEMISYYETVKKELRIKGPSSTAFTVKLYEGLMDYKKPLVFKGPGRVSVIQNRLKEYDNNEEDIPSDAAVYPAFFVARDNSWKNISKEYYERYFTGNIEKQLETFLTKASINRQDPAQTVAGLYEYINRKIELYGADLYDVNYKVSGPDILTGSTVLNELDKSYLFVRLLQYLGIESSLIFYRDNDDNAIISECPALYQLNNMLCRVKLDGQPEYFSFTSSNYAPGQREFRSSQSGALEIKQGGSELFSLADIKPEQNRIEIEYLCTLGEDNTLKVKRTTSYFGILQSNYRKKRLFNKTDLDAWFTARINDIGNNITIESYRFVNPLDDFSKPVVIEEEFTIRNYSYSPGNKMKLFRLPGFEFDASSVAKAIRALPYDNGIVYVKNTSYEVRLPRGYSPPVLPGAMESSTGFYEYKAAYEEEPGLIRFTYSSVTKQQYVPPAEYLRFKKDVEKKADYSKQWILLESDNEK